VCPHQRLPPSAESIKRLTIRYRWLYEQRAKRSRKKADTRKTQSSYYERDPWVKEYTLRRANGICQLCNLPAPFNKKNGDPYLETHHVIWLAEGGDDSIENTVSLCPNCHRKMHVVNSKADRNYLKTEH